MERTERAGQGWRWCVLLALPVKASEKTQGVRRLYIMMPDSKHPETGARAGFYVSTDADRSTHNGRVYPWNGDMESPTLEGEILFLGLDRSWNNPEWRGRMVDGELKRA